MKFFAFELDNNSPVLEDVIKRMNHFIKSVNLMPIYKASYSMFYVPKGEGVVFLLDYTIMSFSFPKMMLNFAIKKLLKKAKYQGKPKIYKTNEIIEFLLDRG